MIKMLFRRDWHRSHKCSNFSAPSKLLYKKIVLFTILWLSCQSIWSKSRKWMDNWHDQRQCWHTNLNNRHTKIYKTGGSRVKIYKTGGSRVKIQLMIPIAVTILFSSKYFFLLPNLVPMSFVGAIGCRISQYRNKRYNKYRIIGFKIVKYRDIGNLLHLPPVVVWSGSALIANPTVSNPDRIQP